MPDLATVPLLLVEDNETDALLLQNAFRSLNFSNPVFAVNSAAQAIDYLEGNGPYADRNEFPLPYLALVDSAMTDVWRFIRQSSSYNHLFVVALTRASPDYAPLECRELGADSFLNKPADGANLDELLQLLRKHWLMLDRIVEFRREMAHAALFQH